MATKINLRAGAQPPMQSGDSAANDALLSLLGVPTGTRAVQKVELTLLRPHPLQEQYGIDEEELASLTESIAQVGVIDPIHIQPLGDGTYRILAGHRRSEGARRNGLHDIEAIVDDVDDATANIIFHATNLEHRELRPSQKARGYAEMAEAVALRGGDNRKTTAAVAELTGDNERTIRRYRQLNNLIPGLLTALDNGKLSLRAANSLSLLKGETQAEILSLSQGELTGEQAEILRQLAADEMLTQARIQRVLDGCKVPVKKKEPAAPQFRQKAAPKYIKLLREDILPYLSKENPSDAEITQSIFEALSLCQKEEE